MARKPKRDLTVEEQLARGPLDLPFLMLTMLLLGVGLIMMFSASFATAYYNDGDPLVYIKNQAVYAAAGVVVMFLVSKINYQTFRLLSVPGIVAAILLLVLALSPLGVELNEVKRWVRIGPIQFQPSEVAKVAVILFFATRLSKRDTEKKKKWSRRTLTGRTLERLDRITPVPQDDSRSCYAHMLDKQMAVIDWTKPARAVDCLIRGLNPWPVALTTLAGARLKVYAAEPVSGHGRPGEVLESDPKKGLTVACGEGALRLTEIQPVGGKRMGCADFLRGHAVEKGNFLGR